MKFSSFVVSLESQTLDPLPAAVYLISATRDGITASFRTDGSRPVEIPADHIVSIDDHGSVAGLDSFGPVGFNATRTTEMRTARRVVVFLDPNKIDPLLAEVLSRNLAVMQAIKAQQLERSENKSCGCRNNAAPNGCSCGGGGDSGDDIRILSECARSCRACRPYDYCRSSDWCCISTVGYACKSCPF